MKIALLLVLAITLPIYGEQTRAKTNSDHEQVQSVEPSTSTVAIKQEHPCDQNRATEKHAQSYFSELISANNLPNILLFFAGMGGIAVGICTLRDIQKQTHLLSEYVAATKQMAVATLRPKLEIKHVFLIPDKTTTGRDEDGHNWRIGCLIANVGGSSAEIVESDINIPNLGIGTLESIIPPDSVPRYMKMHSFGTFTVEAGERKERMVTLDANSEEVSRFRATRVRTITIIQGGGSYDRASDTSPIICFGFVRYKDGSGVARMTGFAWEWNKRDMSFAKLHRPNYDYAD
jgi:hypothetical protein